MTTFPSSALTVPVVSPTGRSEPIMLICAFTSLVRGCVSPSFAISCSCLCLCFLGSLDFFLRMSMSDMCSWQCFCLVSCIFCPLWFNGAFRWQSCIDNSSLAGFICLCNPVFSTYCSAELSCGPFLFYVGCCRSICLSWSRGQSFPPVEIDKHCLVGRIMPWPTHACMPYM